MAIDMLSYAIGAKSGGGGGGGGGCNLFPVTITVDYDNPIEDDTYLFTADKTFAEITEAVEEGKMPLIREDTGSGIKIIVPNAFVYEHESYITFTYTTFGYHSSSTWDAGLVRLTFDEYEGNWLSVKNGFISVT